MASQPTRVAHKQPPPPKEPKASYLVKLHTNLHGGVSEAWARGREDIADHRARNTKRLYDPELVFGWLCPKPIVQQTKTFGSSSHRRAALFTCPDCSLTFVGHTNLTTHYCTASGRVVPMRELRKDLLLYPADVYYGESLDFSGYLPPGITSAAALDCLPDWAWPAYVQDFLDDKYKALKDLGRVFWVEREKAQEWITLQAVDRLISLPRFQVVADLYDQRRPDSFHMGSRSCETTAKHIGSGATTAIQYVVCGSPEGERCAYLSIRPRESLTSGSHRILGRSYREYPDDLSRPLSSFTDAHPAPTPPKPLVALIQDHFRTRTVGLVNCFWDLPIPVRRRLAFAAVTKVDTLHTHLLHLGLRGLLEWKTSK